MTRVYATSGGSGGSSTSPGGLDTDVQFNNAGAFGGESNFIWDTATKKLSINGYLEVTNGPGPYTISTTKIVPSPLSSGGVDVSNEWLLDNATGAVALDWGNRRLEDSSGRIVLKWTSANVSLEHATSHFLANLLLDNLSNDRNYQFPDNSGTIALTSDIPTPVNFADNETPTGTFDGVNITFTLAHTPNPLASLQLFLNGQFQTQGVDYVLVTSSIIYSSPPPDAFSGLPFKAFYRY